MNDQTDAQLLRAYAGQRSEPAFREIVRRHLDFVYSAAVRMVHDPHLAQDICQGVFLALAKNAAQLTDRPVLAGWLHRTAHNLAAQTVRTDVRRRRREQEAAAMNELSTTVAEMSWEGIAPHLDEALAGLNDQERDALVLRYFENKSLRDVGRQLGVSDDAAQKRVSRAVERLREFFAKRSVTVGASGLVVVISANAVQAAPVGLAATISAAAFAGTVATTSTIVAVTTKTIAMTTLQKTLVTATVAVLAGVSIYEVAQNSRLRDQVQVLQQQQTPLEERVRQLQNERDNATNRLADVLAENTRLKANPERTELLKLRGELTRLRNDPRLSSPESQEEASLKTASKFWLVRVNQLKQYVQDHPNEAVPEFQFLNDRAWLAVADAGLETEKFETEPDFDHAMQLLRFQAGDCFGHKVTAALRQFSEANNGKFPNDFSELEAYCSPEVMETLRTLYEIRPASFIPDDEREKISSKFDWFITRKARVTANTTSRLAILADGFAYWQSRP